jgi:hypothetical protein
MPRDVADHRSDAPTFIGAPHWPEAAGRMVAARPSLRSEAEMLGIQL